MTGTFNNNDETREFSDDNITVFMTESPLCQVKLEVKLTPKASRAAHKRAIKEINKEVSLPGFRKGKAPEAMIIKNYSKYVDQQWREVLMTTGFQDALELSKAYPLSQKSIKTSKVESCSLDAGVELLFEYERYPELPDVDCSAMQQKKIETKEVDDADVEKRIEELREQFCEWENVEEGKAVAEGDFVELDIEDIGEEGKKLATDMRFQVSEGEMGVWMRKLVVGLKAEESAEGMSELEDDANEDSKQNFKSTNCRITVKKILKQIKPELDNEFVKKLGVKDLEDLKQKVKEQLQGELEMEAKKERRKQAEELLMAQYPFELPASLVEEERKIRIRERIRELKSQKRTDEEITAMESSIEEEVEQEVDRALRTFFIMRHIAETNKIAVTEQEVQMELARARMYYGQYGKEEDPELKSQIASNVLNDKVKDFLVENIPAAEQQIS